MNRLTPAQVVTTVLVRYFHTRGSATVFFSQTVTIIRQSAFARYFRKQVFNSSSRSDTLSTNHLQTRYIEWYNAPKSN